MLKPWTEGTQTLVSQILTWPYPSEYNVALFSLWYSLLPLSLDCDGINLCFPILFKVLLYAMCQSANCLYSSAILPHFSTISPVGGRFPPLYFHWFLSSEITFKNILQDSPFFLHNLWIIWISTGFPLDKGISLCYNNITGIMCSQEQGLIMV